MIADIARSMVVLVDIQEKLAGAMPKEVINKIVKRCELIAILSKLEDIPIIVTEQYPKGLGKTLTQMNQFLKDATLIEKTTFSCMSDAAFKSKLINSRDQIILAGMEAHICITQTALDLLQEGKRVFILEDAIVSRNILNKQNALNRMRDAGCIISNTESVVFEWLHGANNENFKVIASLIKDID